METLEPDPPPPFWLKRLWLRGYKSIADGEITLEPLTVLVGRNGAGKSNLLDALAFAGKLARQDLREVINEHGGPDGLMHRAGTACEAVKVGIAAQCTDPENGGVTEVEYEFSYSPNPKRWLDRICEQITHLETKATVEVRGGQIIWQGDWPGVTFKPNQVPNPGYSILTVLGEGVFQQLREGLRRILRYNLNPDVMRPTQRRSMSRFLIRDGENAATVFRKLGELNPGRRERLLQFLEAIVHQVVGVRPAGNPFEDALEFEWQTGSETTKFPAMAMSDGTLRAFGTLLAALQTSELDGDPSVVLFEEPEIGLHPAEMQALVGALDEASLRVQVILSTHSPDLLDAEQITPERVRVVQLVDGVTTVGPVREVVKTIVREHLEALGGLERDDRLESETDIHSRQSEPTRK